MNEQPQPGAAVGQAKKSNKGPLIGVAAVAIVVLAAVGFTKLSSKDDTRDLDAAATPNTNGNGNASPAGSAEPVASTHAYKDGTYTATGSYTSPAGPETVTITLTVKGDVITDATGVSNTTHPTSKNFQGMFVSNFAPMVIGKDLSSVSLTKVSGSSLTPKGFNDAVADIRAEAEA